MNPRIVELEKMIESARKEIDTLQSVCNHTAQTVELYAESHTLAYGSYWVTMHRCPECGKMWTTQLPEELDKKMNSAYAKMLGNP